MKMITAVKSCLFLTLATLSFGAAASHCGGANCDPVYVGNPDRPDTIWVPGHYTKSGCWKDGYYVKFYRPVCNSELVWKGDHYDYARPYRAVRAEDVAMVGIKSTCGMKYAMKDCGGCHKAKARYNFVNSEYYCGHTCTK